jgi:hypothetical protein
VDAQNHTPILIAENELTEWSLLGWAGPYTYTGQATVINRIAGGCLDPSKKSMLGSRESSLGRKRAAQHREGAVGASPSLARRGSSR